MTRRFTTDNPWGLGFALTLRHGVVVGAGPLMLEVYW